MAGSGWAKNPFLRGQYWLFPFGVSEETHEIILIFHFQQIFKFHFHWFKKNLRKISVKTETYVIQHDRHSQYWMVDRTCLAFWYLHRTLNHQGTVSLRLCHPYTPSIYRTELDLQIVHFWLDTGTEQLQQFQKKIFFFNLNFHFLFSIEFLFERMQLGHYTVCRLCFNKNNSNCNETKKKLFNGFFPLHNQMWNKKKLKLNTIVPFVHNKKNTFLCFGHSLEVVFGRLN